MQRAIPGATLSKANSRSADDMTLPGEHLLVPSEICAHVEIGRRCLQYLTHSMPAQPLSGKIGFDATRNDWDLAVQLIEITSRVVIYAQHRID